MNKAQELLAEMDEGNPREKKFQDAVDVASNGASSPVISVFIANNKGLYVDLPKKFKDAKKAFAYIKGLDTSNAIDIRADGTPLKNWV